MSDAAERVRAHLPYLTQLSEGMQFLAALDAVHALLAVHDAHAAAVAELERAAEERAKMRAMLLRMAAYREDARHAIKKEPEHRLVQVLQDGANIGYEASALWSKYATDADWEANGGADG